MFDEHCYSGLYARKYILIDHIAKDIRVFWTIFVLDRSIYEQLNVHTKQAYKTCTKKTHKNNWNGNHDEKKLQDKAIIQEKGGWWEAGSSGENWQRLQGAGRILTVMDQDYKRWDRASRWRGLVHEL